MKTLFSTLVLSCFMFMAAQANLIITGVYDGPLSGGTPKGVELYVTSDISDLSQYGIGSANNGQGTDGVEYTFPSMMVTQGTFLYVSTDDSIPFFDFFGFYPNFTDGAMGINGDDAIELFLDSMVVDVFGDPNVDGSGQPWEYLDGWAYRLAGSTAPSATFVASDWCYSGKNALDGETSNSTAATPVPVGTYGSTTGTVYSLNEYEVTVPEPTGLFPITLSAAMAADCSFELVLDTTNSTATLGSDFMWMDTVVTFTTAGASFQTLPLSITDDTDMEGDETIIINVYSASQGCASCLVDSTGQLVITISDDDAIVPVLSFGASSITSNEGDGAISVNVEISNPSAMDTDVDVVIAGGSATVGDDFTFTPTTITFPGGSTAAVSMVLTLIDDAIVESTEDIVLRLSNATNNATLNIDTYTITIEDNDVPPPSYPLYEIGRVTSENTDGVADSLGVTCELQGIVHGNNLRGSGLQFTVIDATSGIQVFSFNDDFGYAVAEGDEVVVRGAISQFRGLTQISPDTVWLVSNNNTINTPALVTALDETTESQVVVLENVTLVDAMDWAPSGGGFNVDVTDGTNTYTVRVDAETTLFNEPAPTGAFNIAGIGGQFASSSSAPFTDGYQLLPRYKEDLDIIIATNNLVKDDAIIIYPNPTMDFLNLTFNSSVEMINIYNVLGQRVQSIIPSNGFNFQLNVRTFESGVYQINFVKKDGFVTRSFIKE